MIVGHYAASMAAKVIEPRVPLWHYIVAAQLIDFAWAFFVLTGIEKARIVEQYTKSFPFDFYYMPFSHSLLAVFLWCVLTFVAYYLWRRVGGARAALVVTLVVMSHWILDLLVHPGDLPLFSVEHKVGYALWNYPILAFVIEVILVSGGFLMLAKYFGMSRKATISALLIIAGAMLATHLTFFYELNPTSISVIASMVVGGYGFVTYVSHQFEKKFGR